MAEKGAERLRSEAPEKAGGKVLEEGETFDAVGSVLKAGLQQLVPASHHPHACLARHRLAASSELQLNNAINVAYNISYTFASMANFFNKDCVAFPGLTAFFLKRSNEEWENAITLSNYLLKRGGIVKLREVHDPPTNYSNAEKGAALYGMELTLGIEKMQFEKYNALVQNASQVGDEEMSDYLSDNFLHPQVELIKQHAEYVAQLRRVGKGHGHWHWDKSLLLD